MHFTHHAAARVGVHTSHPMHVVISHGLGGLGSPRLHHTKTLLNHAVMPSRMN